MTVLKGPPWGLSQARNLQSSALELQQEEEDVSSVLFVCFFF